MEQSITFTRPVFHEKRRISKNYSCTRLSANDPNISPPLAWEGVPEEAKSIALIMHSTETVATDDPWIHWVIWNIPVDLGEFSEGVPQTEELSDGSRQGVNRGATIGYVGPCPPEFILVSAAQSFASGKMEPITSKTDTLEKYFFDLYALDAVLDLAPGATSEELLQTMEGHVLAGGELVGEQLGKFLIKNN